METKNIFYINNCFFSKNVEIVEESKCIHKKFKETESIKKKENNEDVPTENKEPSLQDYEKLLKKYEKIKKVIKKFKMQ